MKVWLDDMRAPPDDSWLVFRTAEDLLEWLGPHMGEVELVSRPRPGGGWANGV
jgi:hypothetical protein